MTEREKSPTVNSVFKSGESTVTEREFTDKWIELIHILEKSKSGNYCEKAGLQILFPEH